MPSGAKRKYSPELVQRVYDLTRTGHSYDEAAEKAGHGLTARKVGSLLSSARERGEIPPYHRKGFREYFDKKVKIGTLQKFFGELPGDIAAWLVEATPKDATVVDTIRGIVTDAYYEEKGE